MNSFSTTKSQMIKHKSGSNKVSITTSVIPTTTYYSGINYKTYAFTNPSSSYNISFSGNCPITALLVGGGGSGGFDGGGGGGGGGVIYSAFTIPSGTYPVVIGKGGANVSSSIVQGNVGGNTIFYGITAVGGGGGNSSHLATSTSQLNGGCGGGAGCGREWYTGGQGTTGQGYNGGSVINSKIDTDYGCGGGGAGGAGGGYDASGNNGNNTSVYGGAGYKCPIDSTYYGGGGGGGTWNSNNYSVGGTGGGGNGGSNNTVANNGFTGLGGGGGGAAGSGSFYKISGSGGSGIVKIFVDSTLVN